MRTSRVVAAVLFATLALAGCTATTPIPTPPTEGELNELVRVELDRQWGFTGLEGVVPRPQFAVEELGLVNGYAQGLWDCMSTAGFESWGFSDAGLQISSTDAVTNDSVLIEPTQQQQLQYYECNARFPTVDTLTADQLDYIYTYYQQWLVPCLELEGHPVVTPPSRGLFTALNSQRNWHWSPYEQIGNLSEKQYVALTQKCKPTIPGIDGWSERFSLF